MENQKDLISFLLAFDEKTCYLNTNKLIDGALGFILKEIKLEGASVTSITSDNKYFQLRNLDLGEADIETLPFIPYEHSHMKEVVELKKPIYRPDIKQYKIKYEVDSILLDEGLKSDFVIPLISDGECIGTLNCGCSMVDGISVNQQQLLLLIAPKLAIALHNAVLYETLQQSEKNNKNLLYAMDDLVFVLDADNRFTSYFGHDEKLHLNKKNFIGKKHEQVMPAEIDQLFQSAIKEVKQGKNAEYSYAINVSGKDSWYSIKLSPLMEDGKYKGLIAVARNITAQKKSEAAIVEAEEKLRLITENTTDNIAILTFDLKAIYTYVNPSVKYVLGFEPEDLVGKSVFDFIHPDDKKALLPLLKRYVRQKVQKFFSKKEIPISETIEFRFIDKAGKWRNMQSTVNIAGKQLLAVTRDITAQKQAEDALLESGERYRGLSEAAFESIFISEKGVCIEQNSTAEKMFGYTLSEAIGRMGTEWIAPEDRDLVMKNMISGYEKPYQAIALRKDGSTFPCEIQGKMMHYKGRSVRVTALNDITLRKKTQELLIENLERQNLVLNSLPIIFYTTTTDKTMANTWLSEQVKNITGFTAKEMMSDSRFWENRIHPDDKKGALKEYYCIFESNIVETQYRWKIASGSYKWFQDKAILLTDENNNPKQIIGLWMDITEKVEAAELLRQSEEKFKAYTNQATEGISVADMDGNYVFVNPAFCKMSGYTREELLQLTVFDMKAPDQSHSSFYEHKTSMKGKSILVKLRRKDGTDYLTDIIGKIISIGNEKLVLGTIRDITDQVKDREALRKGEAQLKEAQNLAQLGSWELDFTTDKLNWSEEVFRIFELDPGHFKPDYKAFLNIIHPDDKDFVDKAFITSVKNHVPYDIVHRSQMNDGRIKFVHERCKTQYDDAGKPMRSLGTIQDITEQKLAEDELEKHREHLEELVIERTAELEEKNAELERFNQLFVGREFRIKELRDKIKILEGKSKPPG